MTPKAKRAKLDAVERPKKQLSAKAKGKRPPPRRDESDEDGEEDEDEDDELGEDQDGMPITRASLGDAYLLAHTAAATSTNLLSTALSSYFTPASLLTSLSTHQTPSLDAPNYKKWFRSWSFELSQNYSVFIHGFGSKRAVLNDFASHVRRARVAAHSVIVIAAYHYPPLASILETLSSVLPASTPTLPSVLKSLHTLKAPIFLAVHSLSHLPPPTLSALFTLSSSPNLHLIASLDHIRSDFLLPPPSRSFNPVFYHLSTLSPYTTEVLASGTLSRVVPPEVFFDPAALNGKKGKGGRGISVESVLQVYRTVPRLSRQVFTRLAQKQIEVAGSSSASKSSPSKASSPSKRSQFKPELSAISYSQLESATDDLFIHERLQALLGEWRDHDVVKSSAEKPFAQEEEEEGDEGDADDGQAASEGWVWINLGAEALEEVLRRAAEVEEEED